MASHLRLSLLVGFGGIQAVDTEFPYRVPIVDRGAIAVPLFADPISDSFRYGFCSELSDGFSWPFVKAGSALEIRCGIRTSTRTSKKDRQLSQNSFCRMTVVIDFSDCPCPFLAPLLRNPCARSQHESDWLREDWELVPELCNFLAKNCKTLLAISCVYR